VLRTIFGTKREELTGELRKINIEELNGLYNSPNFFSCDNIAKIRLGGSWRAYGLEESRVHAFGRVT
jgi:hypothetical protein